MNFCYCISRTIQCSFSFIFFLCCCCCCSFFLFLFWFCAYNFMCVVCSPYLLVTDAKNTSKCSMNNIIFVFSLLLLFFTSFPFIPLAFVLIILYRENIFQRIQICFWLRAKKKKRKKDDINDNCVHRCHLVDTTQWMRVNTTAEKKMHRKLAWKEKKYELAKTLTV